MKSNKKKKITIAVAVTLTLIAVLTIFIISITRIRTFTNIEDYMAANGMILFDVPSNAHDCTFAIRKSIISELYLYSFSLEKSEYEQYINRLVDEYNLNSENEKDKNYGFAHWYEMRVSDCNSDYKLDNFPTELPFDVLTDDNIGEYTIIVYSPRNTGSKCYGLIVNRNTMKVICFYFDAIR